MKIGKIKTLKRLSGLGWNTSQMFLFTSWTCNQKDKTFEELASFVLVNGKIVIFHSIQQPGSYSEETLTISHLWVETKTIHPIRTRTLPPNPGLLVHHIQQKYAIIRDNPVS